MITMIYIYHSVSKNMFVLDSSLKPISIYSISVASLTFMLVIGIILIVYGRRHTVIKRQRRDTQEQNTHQTSQTIEIWNYGSTSWREKHLIILIWKSLLAPNIYIHYQFKWIMYIDTLNLKSLYLLFLCFVQYFHFCFFNISL